MLIGDVNISSYNATLIEREFTNHEVISINDWLDGAPSPIFLREYDRYKNIDLTFLVEGATEQIMINNISAMLQKLKRETIKFADLDYFYDIHMEGAADIKKVTSKAYTVKVNLLAHRTHKGKVTILKYSFSNSDTLTVNNPGVKPVPLFITLKSTDRTASGVTLAGFTKNPIVFPTIPKNVSYTVDGINMRFLRNNANSIKDYNLFEFPMVPVGQTTFDTNFLIKYTGYFIPEYN